MGFLHYFCAKLKNIGERICPLQKHGIMSFQNAFSNVTPVVKQLIIVNVLFMLFRMTPVDAIGFDIDNYLVLHYWEASNFYPFQLISYQFLHGSLAHIFFNMFMLYSFGPAVEYRWGAAKFIGFYLLCGVGAGLVQELAWSFDSAVQELSRVAAAVGESGQTVSFADGMMKTPAEFFEFKDEVFCRRFGAVGASGALMGVFTATAMIYPNVNTYFLFIPFPIKAKYMVLIFFVIDLALGFHTVGGDTIAHFAHVGGMVTGFIVILLWRWAHRSNLKI